MEFKLAVHPEIGNNKTFTGNHRILITTRQTSVVIVLNDYAFEELVRDGNKYHAATAVAAKALQSCALPIPEEKLAELSSMNAESALNCIQARRSGDTTDSQ